MTELLPSLQAEEIRHGLVDYLTTTFALADAEPRRALAEFLEHPADGIFKGPYVRLRLPFRRADNGWQDHLDWQPPFPPYRHQAEAYKRLTSKDLGPGKPRPLPTIVTTGTGSGKTEAFLHPILDHVLRARRRGVHGMKALVLYPMNALADDQANRLTQLLTSDPALSGVTAGLYTGDARDGQTSAGRTRVTTDGLITNRSILRSEPPDILLTNYKMLDQLLLRPEDRHLWEQSALSLTYLVLDEFHTYDGAQGTDVAMLLRRLGLTLKAHVPADHPERPFYDERPLGRLTPVATSATLGDGGDPRAMLAFAEQVFGEPFPHDAAITERRIDIETFTEAARQRVASVSRTPRPLAGLLSTEIEELAQGGTDHRGDGDSLTAAVAASLYGVDPLPVGVDAGTLLIAHPDVRDLIEAADNAAPLDALARERLSLVATGTSLEVGRRALGAVLAALSHLRLHDRDAVSVEITMWIREVTRVDRVVSSEPGFRWTDDGEVVDNPDGPVIPDLPAVFCRACGRSGWGVALAPTGRDLARDDETIRRDHHNHRGRFRALLHAPGEAALVAARAADGDADPQRHAPNLRWLHMGQRTILLRRPADDDLDLLEGRVLPVVMLDGDDSETEQRSKRDDCPSCGKRDQIRFLGSAIATLLSVSLSTLFGDTHLDSREKRALVFTDSVQDAAHRAGFVDHRSHAMSLRAALRGALPGPLRLDEWVDETMRRAETDAFARYRLVPAALADHEQFRPYWDSTSYNKVPIKVRKAVRRRLLFDTALEAGLQSTYGRTLNSTGSIGVHVDAGAPHDLVTAARHALGAGHEQALPDALSEVGDDAFVRWVRGTVEHLRREGGIDHEWLTRYVKDDGARIWIWGRRKREQGAPAFPRGRSAPAFAVAGGRVDGRSAFVRVTSGQSWYARWAAKCLGVSAGHGASIAGALLAELARREVLSQTPTSSGGTAYGIPPGRIVITPLDLDDARPSLLVCDTCQGPLPVTPELIGQLDDGPCPTQLCRGRLAVSPRGGGSFYRRLFASSDMRRVDAREHTSLLDGTQRREIETGFKRADQRPGDPNVLVATPTLELGIDIGDLTTVMLTSLPDSVAKYLQRVGRGGRLTGSSLALAYVTGRGEQLPRLGDPTSMINGAVRPPATYLDAEEILRRQFLASVIDGMVRKGYENIPRDSGGALASTEPGTLLGDVINRVRKRGEKLLATFGGTLDDPDTPGLTALREWVLGGCGESRATSSMTDPVAEAALPDGLRGHDTLEATIYRAVNEHHREVEQARRQKREIEEAIPELRRRVEVQEEGSEQRHAVPSATDEDRTAYRSALAGARLLRKVLEDLTGAHWIAGLEARGLLPNYSLLDDSVQLDAQVSWIDPENGEFDSEPLVLDRGSARALTELAPGAHFYARGLDLRVDGVDIGGDNAEVRHWVACDTCGYLQELTSTDTPSPRVCPRCGSVGIADTGQRFDAVRLKRVFSDVRRDDARIDDSDDQRHAVRFEMLPAVDFDRERLDREWSVPEVGLGVAHYRRLPIRWFNLGRATGNPHLRRLAGREVAASMFRVCETCGKLDSDAGTNHQGEHRAWCPHRGDRHEHTRTIALARELVTQVIAILLPPFVTNDMHAPSSLAAALRLGLRETMGGAPGHLRVEVVPHPVGGDSGEVREALLLHDSVPGGTGYLTELASPEKLWTILATAAQVLHTCECRSEGRSSCHRCLLPFAPPGVTVHRIDALRALGGLLGVADGETALDLDPQAPRWNVIDAAVSAGDGESALEQRFREVLAERIGRFATVSRRPGPRGVELSITGLGGRTWTLRPQVDLHGTRPDFVLTTDGGVAPVAIYTDGFAFHATAHTNRLADDARKREKLRADGYKVVAVTHDDLDSPPPPPWLNDVVVSLLMRQPAGLPGSGISQAAAAEHREGPLGLLAGVVQEPDSRPRVRFSNAAGVLLGMHAEQYAVGGEEDLLAVTRRLVTGEPAGDAAGDTLLVYRQPYLVLASRFRGDHPAEMCLVLDDGEEAVADPAYPASWREWLRLSNLLAMSEVPYRVSTTTVATDAAPAPAPAAETEVLDEAWAGLDLRHFDDEVIKVAQILEPLGLPTPEAGAEVETGSIVELCWPSARVAVVLSDMATDEIAELETAGWAVHRLEADAATVADAVRTSLTDRI